MTNPERTYRRVEAGKLMELVRSLEEAAAFIREVQTDEIEAGIARAERTQTTQLDLVETVLGHAAEDGLSVAEISEGAGIPAASVRMVLYSNKDRFRPEKKSPRRIRWRLSHPENDWSTSTPLAQGTETRYPVEA